MMQTWRKMIGLGLLAILAATAMAAENPAPAPFEEKPEAGFAPEWRQAEIKNATGLALAADAPALTVTGFTAESPTAGGATVYMLERPVGSAAGDFTATLDIDWDLLDNAFMGEVMLQAVTADGKIAAEIGITDQWIAYQGRAGGWIGQPRQGEALAIPLKAGGAFTIVRQGDEYTLRLRDWKLAGGKGTTEPITALRLVFKHLRYAGSDKLPASHFGRFTVKRIAFAPGVPAVAATAEKAEAKQWTLGEPIIWYWAGPDMSDEFAAELAAGGWNVAFGQTMFDLDIMQRHGLRGILWLPCEPDTPENQERLANWLDSIKDHPALYGVSCGDEPGGERMLKAQKRVEFVKQHAPGILHFNNMYPYGASNKQLGHEGTPTEAYNAHIKEYFTRLQPQLLSYDHYTFFKKGDRGSYFNNQAMIRKAALEHDIPSMNIVQGCAWTTATRVPTPDEYRYLAYTSLAYGSQGLSCYVYGYKGHWGSMLDPETGKTGPLYEAAKSINREFLAIAKELQPLKSLGAYHTGEIPYGVEALPETGVFQLEPKLENRSQGLTEPVTAVAEGDNFLNLRPPVTGFILGYFGTAGQPTHVLVVNLDYANHAQTTLVAPGALERFDQFKREWQDAGGSRAKLDIAPGSGVLLRLKNGAAAR